MRIERERGIRIRKWQPRKCAEDNATVANSSPPGTRSNSKTIRRPRSTCGNIPGRKRCPPASYGNRTSFARGLLHWRQMSDLPFWCQLSRSIFYSWIYALRSSKRGHSFSLRSHARLGCVITTSCCLTTHQRDNSGLSRSSPSEWQLINTQYSFPIFFLVNCIICKFLPSKKINFQS